MMIAICHNNTLTFLFLLIFYFIIALKYSNCFSMWSNEFSNSNENIIITPSIFKRMSSLNFVKSGTSALQ